MNYSIEPSQVERTFSNAVNSHDAVAVFAREVGKRMLARLQDMPVQAEFILNLGCRTGNITEELHALYPTADIYSAGLSRSMLQYAKDRLNSNQKFGFIHADSQRLPFATDSFDLVVSNLYLHWCARPQVALQEMQRILKPNGFLLFTTLGPDTLYELRQSWQQVDDYPHVHSFVDMHHVGDALLKSQFKDPVVDVELIQLTYKNVNALLTDLKALGVVNCHVDRRRALTGKSRWHAFISAYEQFRQNDFLPASFEVIYGYALGVEYAYTHGVNQIGEVHIPIRDLIRS